MIPSIIVFQWVLLCLIAGIQVRRFGFSLLHPNAVYILFHTIVFVLMPTLVYSFDFRAAFSYMRFKPDDFEALKAFMVADLGLIVFVSVGLIFTPLNIAWEKSNSRIFGRTAEEQSREYVALRWAFKWLCVLIVPVSVASLAYTLKNPIVTGDHSGGFAATRVAIDAATGKQIFTDSTAYFTAPQVMLGTICLIWAFLGRFRPASLIPFALYCFFRMAQGQGRYTFVLLSLAAAFAYLIQRRKTRPTLIMVALAIPLVLVFTAIGTDRAFIKRNILGLSDVEKSIYTVEAHRDLVNNTLLNGLDLANYQYLSFITTVVPRDTHNFTYFTQYITLITRPIPRVLWKDKPVTDMFTFFNLNDYGNFKGLTTGLVGDGWMSFGWIGVVITMGLASWISTKLYTWFARDTSSPTVVLAYATILALMPQWFRDGGISIVELLGWQIAPILAWMALTNLGRNIMTRQQLKAQMVRQRRTRYGEGLLD